jgi:nitrite reductase/ring-hydroxylating ferredoxin subunit
MTLTIYFSIFFLIAYLVGLAIHRALFLRDKRRMLRESRAGGKIVARVADVEPGEVKKFSIICQKYRVAGFLVNDGGRFHAYVNRCRHMPTPLDFIRDQFVSEDGRYLMCYTHGALYERRTGLCISGPCEGESLYRLPVCVDQGDVLVSCPEGNISHLAD